MVHVAVNY